MAGKAAVYWNEEGVAVLFIAHPYLAGGSAVRQFQLSQVLSKATSLHHDGAT